MLNANSALAGQFYERGKLDNVPIIDFHAHMGALTGGYLPAADYHAMVAAMDAAGVALLLGVSHPALYMPMVGEQLNIEAARACPGRIYAYHGVLSRNFETDDVIKRVESHPDVYVGLKFHSDTHRVAIDDERHAPILAYADTRRLLVLCHTWGDSPYNGVGNLKRVAARYPGITFICGHAFHGRWREGIEMAKDYPNLYMELTAVADDRGVIELLCEGLGSERVLFGVDLPWFSYHYGIGAVLSADISEQDRLNILSKNGLRLLAREGCPASARVAALVI